MAVDWRQLPGEVLSHLLQLFPYQRILARVRDIGRPFRGDDDKDEFNDLEKKIITAVGAEGKFSGDVAEKLGITRPCSKPGQAFDKAGFPRPSDRTPKGMMRVGNEASGPEARSSSQRGQAHLYSRGLTARALGARASTSPPRISDLEKSVRDVADRFGGDF